MSKQSNIAAQQKFGEAVNSRNFKAFNDLVAADSIDHDPAPGQVAGPQGYIDFFTKLSSAFPDMKLAVEQLVADDENVSFAYTLTGTHKGDFNGIPATNKSIEARGMQISKFENGKMIERWGSSDELGILKQIGASISLH
ncbi:ester cyclase [Mucilaginibacter sp. SMC90]|uniref:ester cyclase n=1 Tax=Mucilaginibacter sp. SMC90 TaxID=2929803 RepID=UPI001FB460FA|nr:ester cyclase [Mucilaginibacter sp. SMC90]UOE51640.1 ester cyclase [Mucilaginibacter sp. SMC90]